MQGEIVLNSIADFIEIRPDDIDGETNWAWIKDDTNAWTGPVENWLGAHKTLYYKYLKKQDVVVTAGANHGLHVRFFAKTFGKVYAFEPNPAAFYCLNLNAPYENVVKINAALGSACELVKVWGAPTSSGMWRIETNHTGVTVPCLTIDTLDLDACDFIQLDVEGYENQVLIGARDTITKFRPVIAAENGKTGDILNFMKEMNYTYTDQSSADAIWTPSEWYAELKAKDSANAPIS